MKLGEELPLPLIFTGVIGGTEPFGLTGVFVWPVTLAVTCALLGAWVRDDRAAGSANRPGTHVRTNRGADQRRVTTGLASTFSRAE